MNELQTVYDNRAKSVINNSILWLRGEYYKYIIVPILKKFIEQNSQDGSSVLYGKIVERGSGQGHKMVKTVEGLLGNKFDFYGIEPSQGMREKAREKFRDDSRVHFIDGFAEELPFEDGSIDFIFDIQMQHHHSDEKKEEMIQEAHRVLKPGAHIYILDTFIPPDEPIFGKFKQKVFEILSGGYVNKVGKSEYHNGKLEDTIEMLEKCGFSVNKRYSTGFKVFLGHILGMDFINQIIATKK